MEYMLIDHVKFGFKQMFFVFLFFSSFFFLTCGLTKRIGYYGYKATKKSSDFKHKMEKYIVSRDTMLLNV